MLLPIVPVQPLGGEAEIEGTGVQEAERGMEDVALPGPAEIFPDPIETQYPAQDRHAPARFTPDASLPQKRGRKK